ncbi:carboxypeptidase-like regulatory domain-containing protein [uncultured Formosa sp.]|uniref:carboxypeptidase-like regulatory domain-containing protein n=1 Tax=uncultured Formosa sp. TaxID=255435 RepID=UPI0026276597|nr:carboxypeptidase-like regulatory domain-containing protein [uncultured Formosa sp.]
MKNYTFFILSFVGCFLSTKGYAQMVSIKGEVKGEDDLENIHVINKTSKTFTITNQAGAFEIPAKLHDTLEFSSIQYNSLDVVVDATVIFTKTITINLKAHVNALDEVIVGKILTGNLMLDIGNSTDEPEINFYDVGIPGYMGRRKTQQERLLEQAGEFKPKMLLGVLGGSLPVDPIINALTGRTKTLKKHVAFERNDDLITKIRQRLSVLFFSEHPLDENNRMDFWYFCSDDPNFEIRCKGKRDVEVLAYINTKYIQYIKNLNSSSN